MTGMCFSFFEKNKSRVDFIVTPGESAVTFEL
jgi:hypothetical protein